MHTPIRPMHLELDDDRQVQECIEYHGLNTVKFVDWTKNTVDAFRKCACGKLIDYGFTHCTYCWVHGACEDGETYEDRD